MKAVDFCEDQALKQFVKKPHSEKPRFDWSGAFNDKDSAVSPIQVDQNGEMKDLGLDNIANIIGNALVDLLLSRNQNDIFTEENRHFVSKIVRAVCDIIEQEKSTALTLRDIDLMIERALVAHNAHDVARSLVVQRAHDSDRSREMWNITHEDKKAMTVRLIRRNGQVVPWNESKIEIAVRKGFLALHMDSDPAIQIASKVSARAQESGHAFVHIEDVQDWVQEILMREGYYKVAERYILYRARRAHSREQSKEDFREDIRQESMILVQQEDGETLLWDGEELRKRIDFSIIGLDLCLNKEDIEIELRRSLYPEMKSEALKKTIILNAKALMEKDADFAKFAARLLLTYIYEEVLHWNILRDGIADLKAAHRRHFRRYIEYGVTISRLSKRLLEYDLDLLADTLDPSADLDFDYLGISTLYDRYLIIDKTEKKYRRIETPQFFWMRVAMGLFIEESQNKEDWVIKLYKLYKGRRFCSSTPTLFNSGTNHSQLSSCFLYYVADDLESIMIRGIAENAFLSKWAGGLGGSWTAVRGTGAYIQGTNGESQGVIPFLKLHNDQLVAVNQGGKRRGTGVAYLEIWHNDVYDFLELRRNTGDDRRRTHDMNTAVWIPDLFMKRFMERKDWTLFLSNEVPDLHEKYGKAFEERYEAYEKLAELGKIKGKKVPAVELWRKILTMLFETGHPWITFKDPCNIRSPQDHVGVIHSSNLCTEITLNTSKDETAVCNLGSIVLDSHIKDDGSLDLDKLRETVHIAIRALDNVIDINFYPTAPAKFSNNRHRPIGLGVMGLQNALYKKNISFESDEAITFNDTFMEAIAYYAIEASSDLAAERGTYSTYPGSKWDRGLLPQDTIDLLESERDIPIDISRTGVMDWTMLREKIKKQGMRNSNVMAIAPTATISNIMGTVPCIEPAYKNLYVKSNLSGDFIVLNNTLVKDLKLQGLWNQEMRDQLKYFDGELDLISKIPEFLKQKYKTAFCINPQYLILAAAHRQKWIDQAQSLNLFLKEPNLKTMSLMYRFAWEIGLKTTYYLRTLGASNIEKATLNQAKQIRGLMTQDPQKTSQDELESSDSDVDKKKLACSLEAMLNGGECESCQ